MPASETARRETSTASPSSLANLQNSFALDPTSLSPPDRSSHVYTDPIPSKSNTPKRMAADPEREQALNDYKTKLLESREWEAKLKALRLEIKGLQRDFDVSEENIKALQSVGQIIGEVLKQLDEERCESIISRTKHLAIST